MISVVYYGYLKADAPWQNIIYGQIEDLKNSGICKMANIHIVLTSENIQLGNICKQYILNKIPKAKISINSNNSFEYPGIFKVWEIANKKPDKNHYILYFHSKGMTHRTHGRVEHEKTLFRNTIDNWAELVKLFDRPRVKKIGVFPSLDGFIWFNFFWTRASYIIEKCQKPIKTSNRYYYESWLGKHAGNNQDSYSVFSDSFRGYTAGEAAYNLFTFRKRSSTNKKNPKTKKRKRKFKS